MQPGVPPRHSPVFVPDPLKIYTLPELVDVAEQNNPQTRGAWENAKARAADLGVSKATLYPTLAALALADTNRSQLFSLRNTSAKPAEHFLQSWSSITSSSTSAGDCRRWPSAEEICCRPTFSSTTLTARLSSRLWPPIIECSTAKARRKRCALRRNELAELEIETIQQ